MSLQFIPELSDRVRIQEKVQSLLYQKSCRQMALLRARPVQPDEKKYGADLLLTTAGH
jgi:hypothetical protein